MGRCGREPACGWNGPRRSTSLASAPGRSDRMAASRQIFTFSSRGTLSVPQRSPGQTGSLRVRGGPTRTEPALNWAEAVKVFIYIGLRRLVVGSNPG